MEARMALKSFDKFIIGVIGFGLLLVGFTAYNPPNYGTKPKVQITADVPATSALQEFIDSASNTATKVSTNSYWTYEEIGWRVVLGHEMDQVSGMPCFKVSLADDPPVPQTIVPVYGNVLGMPSTAGWYVRENHKKDRLEIYVVQARHDPYMMYIAMRYANRSRADSNR